MFQHPNNLKKKLDFMRPTYNEPEFKYPCRDVTNHEDRSRNQSEKSGFADDEQEISRDESNASNASAIEKVSVYLRIKPTREEIPKAYAFNENQNNVVLFGNQPSLLTSVEREYTFTSILNQTADQKTVYDRCVRSVMSDPFSSIGAVFSSYGVSNSGKTYTILGESSAGVVPRALTQVFTEYHGHIAQYPCVKVINDQITILDDDQVEIEMNTSFKLLHESSKPNKGKLIDSWIKEIKEEHHFEPKELAVEYQQVYIWISFVEIYNEKMIDLLRSSKDGNLSAGPHKLRIISNNRNSYVLGLTWIHVASIEKALELLQHGLRRVNYAPTGLNHHSSRSHTIFTINMISECDSSYEFSSYKFCDLAGAERIGKTGNVGERLKEAGGINTSLLVLGRCLETVQNNQKPGAKKDLVPVRESKLTFLLQSSLTGSEKFVMIVNLLPTLECFDENINVLHFGSIANKITTHKTESRKFPRCSSRYTYFMQHAVNSPKMNSSLAFNESDTSDLNESSLDLSFKRNNMSADELRRELRKRDAEYFFLMNSIEQKEREFLEKEQELRQKFSSSLSAAKESERKYYKEQEMLLVDCHARKMENLRQAHEQKYQNMIAELDCLERENQKLKAKLGMSDDDAVIDLDDDEEEISDQDIIVQ